MSTPGDDALLREAENFAELSGIRCMESNDLVKRELELRCDGCGTYLCDVEDGDTIRTLVSVALDHTRKCSVRL